ncbi:hypothetical protein E2562_032244 [Oryza meyeriana var. granulata]|uniref:Uncharacterized protein n=1 Tax=Oryza meyeriana var. granulata TaxID=110450 RepID=A0A6G1D9W0_9ORYZ|nr:hypothetical protein E2562_032244 [Oryza meyeriana var. granulata]
MTITHPRGAHNTPAPAPPVLPSLCHQHGRGHAGDLSSASEHTAMNGTSHSTRVVSCNANLQGLMYTEESYSYRFQTSLF